ncbi:hypothetical protein DPMN_107514 [Dreissena polymorpha]|uniref:Uncharacterized protein n=1 Tax=Dreissena polymorpha TaxID=45954 RepID=A0A9D4QL07_DREPO|nr:hypothetical protein DPMN_107514 [Dreissena polymorpha]
MSMIPDVTLVTGNTLMFPSNICITNTTRISEGIFVFLYLKAWIQSVSQPASQSISQSVSQPVVSQSVLK